MSAARKDPGFHAHLPPGGPGRVDDVDPTARPGVPMEHAPEPFPTAPERVVVQRPRVEVLQIPGRKKPAWVVSNAQPPRGLAGRLRRRAFRIPEHHPQHWALLLAADRLEVRVRRAKRWLGFAAGALALWTLFRALEER
jgi:hypothetical protein